MFSPSEINKKIKSDNRFYWFIREWYVIIYLYIQQIFDKKQKNKKKRILFYHINSLGYAGTEKFIQILAKYINKDKYSVYYLYPDNIKKHPKCLTRLEYIKEGGVIAIPFEFKKVQEKPPYFVEGMNPNIQDVIKTLNINLFITPASGSANYPFSIIKNVPIMLLNIFGQPNIQKNIKSHICISKEVAKKISPIVPENKIHVFPVPSEGPTEKSFQAGQKIRKSFNIKESDFVFGRIGRADDGIFDPIGIKAFKKLYNKNINAHYIIMSPPPILIKIVKEENIRNVHFIDPSSKEEDVWAFHQSIDVLAHFRLDGESFGLNIAESMLCGNTIITHRSHIWNAHLEYLKPEFSRVAEKDNVDQYEQYMEEMIKMKQDGKINEIRKEVKEYAENMFLIKNNIEKIESIIEKYDS